ncbi:TP901 family phage tail tape measure protein [Chryseobacterium sp. 52]|uniref:phage tail tape measure protein n=1 Tax=Chryseobacterium sp. 52 TaxID=2035213 RepID=UPI000C187F2E|nr:phage tail tape measure protein [Chryseobacterium sp. 52]PIF44923.1 TP901 family phage tail tape measure protein [Chryseobacterium sp. 52]
MSTNTATYNINFTSNNGQLFPQINVGLGGIQESVQKTTKVFGDCYKALLAVNLASEGISTLKNQLDNLIAPGVKLNSNMAELSAITGVTGQGLKDIEMAARSTAKTFGTDASSNVESYKLILSQLSPEIAKSSEAMKMMGDNVNILSKQMKGDTVAATNVLTTSMNQFGVSTKDPIAAAKIMADMMNVMSAGAQAGSAELPQIQSALEQVGMVAKTTGLSFIETNAQIQLLDKSGKKGSEGGIALRNVLTTLSEGRFASKDATAGLAAAGISTTYLANASIPLTDRLRTLRKIQGDTALMTKVFGKENMAAGIAMIQGADNADQLAKQMVNTNSATDQAGVIMGSYEEKMNRAKAVVNDWKISIFNATEAYIPYIQHGMTAFKTAGELASSYEAVKSVLQSLLPKLFTQTAATEVNTVAEVQNTTARGVGAVVNRIYASTINAIGTAYLRATLSVHGFSLAMMNIPVIGWIIAGVVVLIAGIKLLWDHSKRFREILFGVWEAGKAAFYNIGIFVTRLWNLILKPIALFIFNIYKSIFLAVWDVLKIVVNGIGSAISWVWNSVIKPVAGFIYNAYKTAFLLIWNTVKSVFQWIWETVLKVWNWIKQTFGGFASWISETIINPIREAFSGIWKWITELLDKIMNKLGAFFKPIKDLWNQLFSSEGMKDINVAYKEGEKKGAASFDKDHPDEKKTKAAEPPKDDSHKAIFDVSKGSPMKQTTFGADAADKTKKKKGSGDGGDSGNKVRNLNITKLVENLNIYNQNGSTMSKESIKQMVQEALLTASADFTLAE